MRLSKILLHLVCSPRRWVLGTIFHQNKFHYILYIGRILKEIIITETNKLGNVGIVKDKIISLLSHLVYKPTMTISIYRLFSRYFLISITKPTHNFTDFKMVSKIIEKRFTGTMDMQFV
jgi:hypothetical protein